MSRRPGSPAPPAVAVWLLSRALPESIEESLLGDLGELFQAQIAAGRSRHVARQPP